MWSGMRFTPSYLSNTVSIFNLTKAIEGEESIYSARSSGCIMYVSLTMCLASIKYLWSIKWKLCLFGMICPFLLYIFSVFLPLRVWTMSSPSVAWTAYNIDELSRIWQVQPCLDLDRTFWSEIFECRNISRFCIFVMVFHLNDNYVHCTTNWPIYTKYSVVDLVELKSLKFGLHEFWFKSRTL